MCDRSRFRRRRAVARILCSAGLLLLAASACTRPEPGDVLLVSVDTLRPDHLGSYGYERSTSPQIDRWFADAAVFERAYTTNAHTSPSVVSMLTGQLPHEHRVRLLYQLLPEGTQLLPDLLPRSYQTAAFVSNIVLTDEAMGIARHFDHYDDHVDERESVRRIFERKAARTTDAALRWLDESRDEDRPLFLWIHYIDPHGPYRPPPGAPRSFQHEGRVPLEKQRINDYQLEPGVEDALAYVDRYDEEIAYVDAEIGRLLDGYAARYDAASALMIFAADHGESMIEHERWFTHGYQVHEEIIRIPLLLRGPGIETGRREELVSLIDVVPTVLHFAGVSPDASLSGVPLQRASRGSRERVVFAEGGSGRGVLRAAVQGDRKWVVRVRAGERRPDRGFVLDLGTDPAEQAPVAWGGELQGEAARRLLEITVRDPDPGGEPVGLRKGVLIKAPKVDPRADAETLERLRALGYAE